jgi:hypothetical protein
MPPVVIVKCCILIICLYSYKGKISKFDNKQVGKIHAHMLAHAHLHVCMCIYTCTCTRGIGVKRMDQCTLPRSADAAAHSLKRGPEADETKTRTVTLSLPHRVYECHCQSGGSTI